MLFAVALALGAFVWFYEIQGEESRLEAEEATKRLFVGIDPDAIERIALVTEDDRQAVIERRDGVWRVAEPVDFPGDATTLDGMATALANLTSEGSIDDPQDFAVYGLDDDERVVRFTAGGTEYGLRLGAKTPVGSNSYVATLDSDRVEMVPSYRLNSLKRDLDALRDSRVLAFDRSAVEAIRLAWPGGGVRLERRDGGWRLLEPLEGPADDATVDTLLSDLSFLRADGFVDEPPPDSESGLDRPEFEAILQLGRESAEAGEAEQESEAAQPVEIGFRLGSVQDGTHRLARGALETLYRIREERLADFPRNLVAYRFKELARFSASEAEAFELIFQEGAETLTIRGERGESGWTTAPDAMAAGKAGRLVSELSRLDGIDIAADAMEEAELAELGLAPPRVRLAVYGEAEEGGAPPVLADVSLGEADPDLGIAALRAGGAAVYRVENDLAENVPVSLEAFRNRFVSEEIAEEEGDLVEDLAPEDFTVDPALGEDGS